MYNMERAYHEWNGVPWVEWGTISDTEQSQITKFD